MNEAKDYVAKMVSAFHPSDLQGEFFKFLLQHGKEFKAIKPSKELRDLLKKFKHFRVRKRACYFNAQMLTIDSNGRFRYYEGYATTTKMAIGFEHGFNVYDGQVVDLSWPDGADYFGVEIPVAYLRKRWIATGMAGRLLPEYFLERARVHK